MSHTPKPRVLLLTEEEKQALLDDKLRYDALDADSDERIASRDLWDEEN